MISEMWQLLVMGLIGLILYFIPTMIARKRDLKIQKQKYIFILNIVGFLGISWLAAFIWAFLSTDTKRDY